MDKQPIEMASLGRPFGLGMLYDCCTDSLCTGLSLWDHEQLLKHIGERPQYNSHFEIVASESREDKSSALNIDAALELKVLLGLIKVEGSAKYLLDSKKSKNQARVTLKYEVTTKFQQLSMDHLGANRVKYQDILKERSATHVVTGILFGARAFFVFDREVSEDEDYEEIQGNLSSMIHLIAFRLKCDASLETDARDVKADKFSCKFIGDFALETNPVTYQDAVQVYRSLPQRLGARQENVVPMKVWLLPLTFFDSSFPKVIRHISTESMHKVKCVLEDFTELEMRCNDALNTSIAQQFPVISTNLGTFKVCCCGFQKDFKQALVDKYCSRGDAAASEEIFTKFDINKLTEWLDWAEKEIYILKSFINLKSTKIIQSEEERVVEALNADHAVCFVFTSLLSENLEQKLKPDALQDPDLQSREAFSSALQALGHKAKLFADFAEANTNNNQTRFLTVGLAGDTKGTRIQLYKDGRLVTEDFEPPSKPETVTGSDVTHNSVTLSVRPARSGADSITCYWVESRISGKDEWKQMASADKTDPVVTVNGLTPNTEYRFRCRAATSAGVGPAGECSESVKTLPTSPPGNLQARAAGRQIEVTWEKPAEVLNYIVEFTKTKSNGDLQWNQTVSAAETGLIPGLQPQTEYTVRVQCDCGATGRSRHSSPVDVSTTRGLKERLKSVCHRIKSASPSVYKLPLKDDRNPAGCRTYSLGTETQKPLRTVMLLGATGTGKSALIDTMINYILGVEWSDDFRFTLHEAEKQTPEVTVYKFHHQEGFEIPFSLTVVDTPGFVATAAQHRDEHTRQKLCRLFTSEDGVREIDAVCVVAAATASQKYASDSALSIFGKDVLENVRVLETFADGKCSSVLEALNSLGIQCHQGENKPTVHFTFNNSALFQCKWSESGPVDEEDGLNEMFWSMNVKSWKKFFDGLGETTIKSLALTEEVLRVREELEDSLQRLQRLQRLLSVSGDVWSHVPCCSSMIPNPCCPCCPDRCLCPEHIDVLVETLQCERGSVCYGMRILMEMTDRCLSRLAEIALKPLPASTPEYIHALLERERRETQPGWRDRAHSLMVLERLSTWLKSEGETSDKRQSRQLSQDELA